MTPPFEPDWSVGARDVLGAVRRARGGPGSRLVRELERVECVELVRCFLEAASRRLRASRRRKRGAQVTARGGAGVAAIGADRVASPGGTLAAERSGAARVDTRGDWFERLAARPGWRRRARTAWWALLGQGSDHEEFVFLADLLDRPVSQWPSASTIVEHARLVGDGPAVAHAHARALEMENEVVRAQALYVAELDRPGGVRRAARIFEGLARVHRSRGHPRRALAPVVDRCRDWPFRPAALAEALATSLALGDRRAAQRLAAVLAPHRNDPRVEAAFHATSKALAREPADQADTSARPDQLPCDRTLATNWRATLAALLAPDPGSLPTLFTKSHDNRSAPRS